MPLTIQNSGALVAGAPLSTKTRRVRVVRAFMVGSIAVHVDQVLTLPAIFASEMVSASKAMYEPDEPAAPAAPAAAPTKAAKATKE